MAETKLVCYKLRRNDFQELLGSAEEVRWGLMSGGGLVSGGVLGAFGHLERLASELLMLHGGYVTP